MPALMCVCLLLPYTALPGLRRVAAAGSLPSSWGGPSPLVLPNLRNLFLSNNNFRCVRALRA